MACPTIASARRALGLLLAAAAGAAAALAQPLVFELSPNETRVEFTLPDVLHTVHGAFRLKSGVIRRSRREGRCKLIRSPHGAF